MIRIGAPPSKQPSTYTGVLGVDDFALLPDTKRTTVIPHERQTAPGQHRYHSVPLSQIQWFLHRSALQIDMPSLQPDGFRLFQRGKLSAILARQSQMVRGEIHRH